MSQLGLPNLRLPFRETCAQAPFCPLLPSWSTLATVVANVGAVQAARGAGATPRYRWCGFVPAPH